MKENIIVESRRLAEFIQKKEEFSVIESFGCPYNNHVGALFTDIILQSGLNYKYVVQPRVNFILENYPEAYTVERFFNTVDNNGVENVLQWKDPIKINRLFNLFDFCFCSDLNFSVDIKIFLANRQNQLKFLEVNGIGNKTLDYLLKLLNVDTIAVDRHIYSFVKMAGIDCNDYDYVKNVVEYAADIMNISRRSIDHSIWQYMSTLKKPNKQLKLELFL